MPKLLHFFSLLCTLMQMHVSETLIFVVLSEGISRIITILTVDQNFLKIYLFLVLPKCLKKEQYYL